MSVVYPDSGSCAPSLTRRKAGVRIADSQTIRSTSASDRTTSKRRGSLRATISGRRSKYSSNCSLLTGSSVSSSGDRAAAPAVPALPVASAVLGIVTGVGDVARVARVADVLRAVRDVTRVAGVVAHRSRSPEALGPDVVVGQRRGVVSIGHVNSLWVAWRPTTRSWRNDAQSRHGTRTRAKTTSE